jgi:hypothetical protein
VEHLQQGNYKRSENGDDFHNISATKGASARLMAELDSAHQICPSTSLKGVLPAGGAFVARKCKSSEIGADFHDICTTRGEMGKRMAAMDSAHKLCLFTLSDDIPVVVWGPCGGTLKKCENRQNRTRFRILRNNQR